MKFPFLWPVVLGNDFNFDAVRPQQNLDDALKECARQNQPCTRKDLQNEIKLDARLPLRNFYIIIFYIRTFCETQNLNFIFYF